MPRRIAQERVPTASNVGSRDVTWASQPTPLIPFRVFSRVSRAPFLRQGPTRRDRSNIAVARFLDMPRRIAQERVPTASNVGSRDVTWASQPTPLIPFRVFSRVSRAPFLRQAISISRRTHATRKSRASELKAVCLEKDYEHHPFNCSDPAVDRRAANLAVQRRLGLLSDRRPWPAGSDRVDSRLVQTHLVHRPITGNGSRHR